LEDKDPNLTHLWYQEQEQIDQWEDGWFAAISNAGGSLSLPRWQQTKLSGVILGISRSPTLLHAAFAARSNHFWTICACTPRFDHGPPDLISDETPDDGWSGGAVTPDGYAVKTLYSVYQRILPTSIHRPVRPNRYQRSAIA